MSSRVVPLKGSMGGTGGDIYDRLLDDEVPPPNKNWACIFISSALTIVILGVAILIIILFTQKTPRYPIIAATWTNFEIDVNTGYEHLIENGDSLMAAIETATSAEINERILNVGPGGKPNMDGEVTLDALVMYGPSHYTGAVGNLKNISYASKVALSIMLYTRHTMLVGDDATNFVNNLYNSIPEDSLFNNFELKNISDLGIAQEQYQNWTNDNCQPNFLRNFEDSNECNSSNPIPFNEEMYTNPNWNDGPVNNSFTIDNKNNKPVISKKNHDTIGVITIDSVGRQSIVVSTNGLEHKVPGRVGDSPLPGSGGYVDQGVGAAVATGNGDIIMQFCPCKTAVLYMKLGRSVQQACDEAIMEILDYYPDARVALLCMDSDGVTAGSSSYPSNVFGYLEQNEQTDGVDAIDIERINYESDGSQWTG